MFSTSRAENGFFLYVCIHSLKKKLKGCNEKQPNAEEKVIQFLHSTLSGHSLEKLQQK